MTNTDHPLHRSQRAVLPHWALASGHNEETLLGIGVADLVKFRVRLYF